MSQALPPAQPAYASSPTTPSRDNELRAAFRNRGFLIVFVIMLLSAAGLNAAIKTLGLHFQKQPVPLRMSLDRLPRQFGPWVQLWEGDIPMTAEMQHELGTKDYLTRDYIDTRKMVGFDRTAWDALTDDQRGKIAVALLNKSPDARIRLHMAYYTGLVDTVAHVPERCYVGSGFDPVDPQVVSLDVFRNDPERRYLKAKYSAFTDRSSGREQTNNVAYLFQVNGSYEYDSLRGVRFRLQNITERYGYYCKIELMTNTGSKTEVATRAMADFLSYAMPSIEQALPDWQKTTGLKPLLNTPREGY